METPEQLNHAFESASGVFLLSDTAGSALYVNGSVERRTGFSVGEVVGKAPGKLWGGRMPRAFYDRLWTTIERRGAPFVGTVNNRRKDGTVYPELLAIAPLWSGGDDTAELFLALQVGEVGDAEARQRFSTEFRNLFTRGKDYSEAEILRWMMRSLGARYEAPETVTGNLANTLRKALVMPFEKRFRARKEDRLLIEAAQIDQAAFQTLYDKYRHTVFLYLVRHTEGNVEAAEDLTQDTFYRALRYLRNFRVTNASYGTYLVRIAHNVLVNFYRRRRELPLTDEIGQSEAAETAPAPEETILSTRSLLETERRVLGMKYVEGFSVHEIATTLNKSENAVKLVLSRARKKLRRHLTGR